MPEIELLRPLIWKNSPSITAAVTTANTAIIKGGKIAGLNMSHTLEENRELVEKHRSLVLHALTIPNAGMATGGQIHSSNIAVVDKPGFNKETDGLITVQKNLCLGILIADCAAVLIADSKNGVIAALHAGWRGAVSNIVPDAVETMTEFGAEAEHMQVYISPCISEKNFEVGEEVARQFPEKFVNYKSYRKPHVRLREFIISQLLKRGVKSAAISADERCTVDDNALYSYRRQKHESGRMMAIICRR